MSDLDRFEVFAQVAHTQSITQTAKQLSLTKAAISKQIKRLEKELQVDLFLRQGQRLHLTDVGQALFAQCLRIKKELDDTRSLCQQFHEEPVGQLQIAVIGYYAKKFILPKLPDFIARYPKLEIVLNTNERLPDFSNEAIDLAVGFSVDAPLDIVRRQIGVKNYVLCGAPDYFKQFGKPKSLKDLAHHRYLAHTIRFSATHLIYFKAPHHFSVKPFMIMNSVDCLIDCAIKGLGLIQLPESYLQEYLLSGQLISVLPQYQAKNVPI